MTFGEYIREKRVVDGNSMTLEELSSKIGISRFLLSDVERGVRMPFGGKMIERFCSYFQLSKEEKARMYDLAVSKIGQVPEDILDIFQNSPIGDLAIEALRLTKDGALTKGDWTAFIESGISTHIQEDALSDIVLDSPDNLPEKDKTPFPNVVGILFVDSGNVCRSPMAEFVMKGLVEKAGFSNRFYVASSI